jgi:tight adherence protein B
VELILASALAFVSFAAIVYVALTSYLPVIQGYVEKDYLEVDRTLRAIFYTAYDAKVFILLKYAGPVVAVFVGVLLLQSLVFGLFLGAILFWLPGVLLENMIKRRRERLEEQASDVMTAFSACVKSGMTLEQSIDEIANSLRPPVAQEFALIRERIDAGETIIAALKATDGRLGVPRLSLIFQSIIVSQERGGRLASLMDSLSASTREIERVEERVKTETAGLRLSARIMLIMPVLICFFLYMAEPDQVTMLFTTVIGNVILVIAIALDIGAFMIMRKLIDLDV